MRGEVGVCRYVSGSVVVDCPEHPGDPWKVFLRNEFPVIGRSRSTDGTLHEVFIPVALEVPWLRNPASPTGGTMERVNQGYMDPTNHVFDHCSLLSREIWFAKSKTYINYIIFYIKIQINGIKLAAPGGTAAEVLVVITPDRD